ncbi:single-stranded-DNA-specific exonuclease [Inquilinus ginsengisoli]|uniref:Single-stranded-DNA-specific exonuclease RecJ n=1 Tax=Inquilinus ginsengisoli TaxID=363840 RepID=A0ABU1JJ87_9PROT|nr:single-stranded-DNA-specific exonuclease RecJ [Inquilinus ginsengisoli]MDR6288104.1 single-stranded-DNA-specific exonuclease [Inquilinus ginsengisoli]
MTGAAVAAPSPEFPAPALFGVESSAKGARWIGRAADDRLALALAQRHALPEIVARVLAARGIGLDDAKDFLNPTLRALLPDPLVLRDMDRAADRIARAVTSGEGIAIFGDYDVDGATSTALLTRYLRAVGVEPQIHIPDRIAEGYGPNAQALEKLRAGGAGLVVTVDCGTTAFEALEGAMGSGLDVVVIDHHTAEPRLPRVAAVVNPNRLDQDPGLGQLAACGVVFLALVALNRVLRRAGLFANRAEPDLMALLDLVALGTICDVVPLTGLNRALVGQGLKVMAQRRNIGLAALADVARVTETVDAYHAGYLLGPRINAGGRIGRADLGARLLATEDREEATRIAALLDEHNVDRKTVEADVMARAIAQAEAAGAGPMILVAGEGWHPGVVGIVAGRLRERYGRPACVVGFEGGIGKASGRSVPGVDLGAAVIAARQAGLLLSGGGHRMAAGFTVRQDLIAELHDFLSSHIHGQSNAPMVPVVELDGTLVVEAATVGLAETLAKLGPYGAGNPEPRFALPRVRVVAASVVGSGGHVACTLVGPDNGRLRAIAFRCADQPLGQALLRRDALVHVAGTLRLDRWNGNLRVQLFIEDVAPVWAESA